jgi:threonine-phosphate decarboxylase
MTKARKAIPIPTHGGQLAQISRQFGIPECELLDFSTNLNLNGPPSGVLRALSDALTRPGMVRDYPDLELLELRSTLASYAGAGRENIVIANGVVPLLEAALRAARVRKCLLILPSFSEYRKALTRCGVEVHPYLLEPQKDFRMNGVDAVETVANQRCDAILLANPQNPSGVIVDRKSLVVLTRHALECGAKVFLDEAFIDYVPTESLSTIAPALSNLVVFRSLTKFFAMAGLRIAYAIAESSSAFEIREIIPSWAVTTLAVEAACGALDDKQYRNASRLENERERESLKSELCKLKLKSFESKANYLLLRLPQNCDSSEIWKELIISHGIVTRCCDNFEGLRGPHLRIAVKSRKYNAQLVCALDRAIAMQTSGRH